jgi:hypothetical protein
MNDESNDKRPKKELTKKQFGEKEQCKARYHGRDFKENLFILLQ